MIRAPTPVRPRAGPAVLRSPARSGFGPVRAGPIRLSPRARDQHAGAPLASWSWSAPLPGLSGRGVRQRTEDCDAGRAQVREGCLSPVGHIPDSYSAGYAGAGIMSLCTYLGPDMHLNIFLAPDNVI